MKTPTHAVTSTLLGISLAVSLAACNAPAAPTTEVATAAKPPAAARPATPRAAPVQPRCADCGTISGIEQMKVKGEGSGIGAVLGAVAGAVVGHQFGNGRGQDAATATGAIAGGITGHQIERRIKGKTYFHVTVAMETGGTRTVDVDNMNGLSTGSKVKIVGNNLQIA